MDLKGILKPTIVKVVLFLILMVVFTYVAILQYSSTDLPIKLVGLPLEFLPWGTYGAETLVEFSIVNFAVNLIFWYIISAVIISLIYRKRSGSSA